MERQRQRQKQIADRKTGGQKGRDRQIDRHTETENPGFLFW